MTIVWQSCTKGKKQVPVYTKWTCHTKPCSQSKHAVSSANAFVPHNSSSASNILGIVCCGTKIGTFFPLLLRFSLRQDRDERTRYKDLPPSMVIPEMIICTEVVSFSFHRFRSGVAMFSGLVVRRTFFDYDAV